MLLQVDQKKKKKKFSVLKLKSVIIYHLRFVMKVL